MRKYLMIRNKSFIIFFPVLLPVLLLVLLLTGCELYGKVGGEDVNIQGALPELLQGEWVYTQPGSSNPAERYIFEGDTIQYGYGGGGSDTDYAGKVEFVSNYSADSGVIIIRYAETGHPSYVEYNGNSFTAVYYRGLKRNSVQMANVINLANYDNDKKCADTTTLEEAVQKFTRLQMGNYVNWSNVMPQTRVR